jgi:hypothetical protein
MKKTILSALMIGLLSATAAMPSMADNASSNKKLNPWQECGIGAMVFPANGVAAAISNIIWDLGTTAVSSNISSQESCSGVKAKTAMFIKATMPVLEQDIVMGEGEYVTAMLELRGCETTSHEKIVKAIREDYKNKPSEDAEAFYNSVESRVSESFTGACVSA